MSHLKLDSRREMARPVHPIADYLFGRENIARHADRLAVALPWSTSMTLAFIVLWLLALLASAASRHRKCPGDRVFVETADRSSSFDYRSRSSGSRQTLARRV